MNIVGHETVCPNLYCGLARLLSEQIPINLMSPFSKKIASRRFPLCVTWCGRPATTVRANRAMGKINTNDETGDRSPYLSDLSETQRPRG